MLRFYQQKGFHLIELMVGLVVGAILLLGLMSLLESNVRVNMHNSSMIKLNHELRTTLGIIEQDIRRAGYWNQASTMLRTGVNTNPFDDAQTDLMISPDGRCVLYSYDLNNDGVLAAIDDPNNNERFGFRLNNQSLQMRPARGNSTCEDQDDLWDNMTNPAYIRLDVLNFTVKQKILTTAVANSNMVIRSVGVSLTGSLTQDPTKTQTVTTEIKVNNDKFTP